MLLLLAACGGGGDVRDPGPEPARVTVQGRLVDVQPVAAGTLTAKPRVGLPTTAAHGVGSYELIVEQMQGPVVLLDGVSQLAGVALGPGTAHVTPLTHLLLAELQGDDPVRFFDVLGPVGGADFSRLTAEGLADAEQRLRQRLLHQFGLAVPAAVADFSTMPFEPVAGDPMAELLAALQAALERQGLTRADLVQQVALHGRQCERARVDLVSGDQRSTLCPAQRATAPAAAGPALTELRFTDDLGDTLLVQLLADAQVHAVRWQRGGRTLAACDGAACTGLTVGAPDAAGQRTLRFDGTPLGGTRVSGTLVSGEGEVAPACAGRRFTALHGDGTVEEDCVARRVALRQYARVVHAFIGTLDGTRALDVRLDGDTVAWVALMRTYGGVDYRCAGAECRGVTLGAPDADGVRPITLAGTTLWRSLGGGQVDPQDTVRLDAALLSARTPAPPVTSCPSPVTMQLASSDGVTLPLCELNPGASIGFDDTDFDGRNETISTGSANALGDSVDITYNLDTARVVSLTSTRTFLDGSEPAWACDPDDCPHVSATLTADSRYLFRVDGTPLAEVLPDGTPGPRRLVLTGTLLSGALVVNPGD